MTTEAQERRQGRIGVIAGATLYVLGGSMALVTGVHEAARQAFAREVPTLVEFNVDPRTPLLLGASALVAALGLVFQAQGNRILDRLDYPSSADPQ